MGETDCGGNWFLFWSSVKLQSNFLWLTGLCSLPFVWPETSTRDSWILTWISTGDSWILTGQSNSVSCVDTASFTWLLVHRKFCLCHPRVCFPPSCILYLNGLKLDKHKLLRNVRFYSQRHCSTGLGLCVPVAALQWTRTWWSRVNDKKMKVRKKLIFPGLHGEPIKL